VRSSMRKTLLTAHSGCDGTPDNSGAFLEYAMALDADCVEVDVRMTPDGRLVLAYDDGPAPALLSDALTLLRGHPEKMLNCDLKQRDLEILVWALARESGVGGQIAFSGEVSALAA
jgi:glycerophosphoryl diester phosphodiesterase